MVPPQGDIVIFARCNDAEEFSLEPDELLFTPRRAGLTHGVTSIKANEPCNIIVANFAKVQVELPKEITLDNAILPRPAEVYRLEPVSEDNRQRIATKADRPQEEAAKTSLSQIDIDCFTEREKALLMNMLNRHKSVGSGEPGEIQATLHRIDWIPGTRPARAHPYRVGPQAQEIEDLQVNRTLHAGVIELAQSELGSPMVLVPNPYGSLRSCVYYRGLNALTVGGPCTLPRMDELLDFLG